MQGHALLSCRSARAEKHTVRTRGPSGKGRVERSLTLRQSGTEAGRVRPEAGVRDHQPAPVGTQEPSLETFQTEVVDGKRIGMFSQFLMKLTSNSITLVSVHTFDEASSIGSLKDPGFVKPPVFLWSKEPLGIFHCQLFYNSVTLSISSVTILNPMTTLKNKGQDQTVLF